MRLAAERPVPRTLTWEEALATVRAHNEKVRAAALEVTRAEEALDQVRRSLIPTADFDAGYDRAFGRGGAAGLNPFFFAADLFLDVPGLVGYRARYQAAQLTLLHARLAHDAIWREQVVELYRSSLAGARLAARADRLGREKSACAQLSAAAPRRAAAESGRIAALERSLAADRIEWQARLGGLLGQPGGELSIAAASLPPLGYDRPEDRPAASELAKLPLRLAAVELVALRARQLGVRLQAWPEANITVISPSLYTVCDSRRREGDRR